MCNFTLNWYYLLLVISYWLLVIDYLVAIPNSPFPIPHSPFPIPNFNLPPQILPICSAIAVDLPPHLQDDP